MSSKLTSASTLVKSDQDFHNIRNQLIGLKPIKIKNSIKNRERTKTTLSRKPIDSDFRQQKILTCTVIFYSGRTSIIFFFFSIIYFLIALECDFKKILI